MFFLPPEFNLPHLFMLSNCSSSVYWLPWCHLIGCQFRHAEAQTDSNECFVVFWGDKNHIDIIFSGHTQRTFIAAYSGLNLWCHVHWHKDLSQKDRIFETKTALGFLYVFPLQPLISGILTDKKDYFRQSLHLNSQTHTLSHYFHNHSFIPNTMWYNIVIKVILHDLKGSNPQVFSHHLSLFEKSRRKNNKGNDQNSRDTTVFL